jgi:hypothetical protein
MSYSTCSQGVLVPQMHRGWLPRVRREEPVGVPWHAAPWGTVCSNDRSGLRVWRAGTSCPTWVHCWQFYCKCWDETKSRDRRISQFSSFCAKIKDSEHIDNCPEHTTRLIAYRQSASARSTTPATQFCVCGGARQTRQGKDVQSMHLEPTNPPH